MMPGRKFEPASGYRYGFNGKEKEKDMNSLTAYDYGFRIYNPAIGRFLSVDPLSGNYPWYTPYQFAGNKPIKFIDLDGLEEADPIQIIQEPKSKGEPGLGYTTARKTYFVITKGSGALNEYQQSTINTTDINTKLNSTPKEPAFFITLPNSQGGGMYEDISERTYRNLFSENEAKKRSSIALIDDPFYAIDLEIDIDIIIKSDVTLEEVVKTVISNPKKYGIILNDISGDDLSKLNIPSSISDLLKDANKQFRAHSNPNTDEAEAYGSVADAKINNKDIDIIVINSNAKETTLSMTDRIAHEVGHNLTNNSHTINGRGDYEYNQRGLQSNEPADIVPSSKNKIDILNHSKIEPIYDKVETHSPNA